MKDVKIYIFNKYIKVWSSSHRLLSEKKINFIINFYVR